MTHEEFMKNLERIPDEILCIRAEAALGKMCTTGGRSFVMSIPPRLDDTDMVLGEVLRRLKERSNKMSEEDKKVYQLSREKQALINGNNFKNPK